LAGRLRRTGILIEAYCGQYADIDEFLPTEGVIKQDVLGRQTISTTGVAFAPRQVVLSANKITFGKVGSNKALDSIPLIQIESVTAQADKPASGQYGDGVMGGHAKNGGESLVHRAPTWQKKWAQTEEGFAKFHEAEVERSLTFCIQPIQDGYNSGKSVLLRADSVELCDEWMKALDKAVKEALIEAARKESFVLRLRRIMRDAYKSNPSQYLTGLVIMASYFASIAGAQVRLNGQPPCHLSIPREQGHAVFDVLLLLPSYSHTPKTQGSTRRRERRGPNVQAG